MDMAGFAVNVNLFFKFPDARFSNEVPRGFLESTILEQLNVKMEDLEPRAENCSKVSLNKCSYFPDLNKTIS